MSINLNSNNNSLPIKPVRTVSFQTEEGTYLNVDISPDGKTLLFDLLGELFTMPSAGGKAVQLTKGLAINRKPKWSPDGKRIAFISDYSGSFRINILEIKTAKRYVLGDQSDDLHPTYSDIVCWHPDGNFVTVMVEGKNVSYGLAGANIESKIKLASRRSSIAFSKDGQYIYYVDARKLHKFSYSEKKDTVISDRLPDYLQGKLSTDAKYWVYVADSNKVMCLFVKDLANNHVRLLVKGLVTKWSDLRNSWTPIPAFSFSPECRYIYIGYSGKIHRINLEDGDNEIIPFIADVKVDMGRLNYNTFPVSIDSFQIKYCRNANTSPDGRQVVFSALNKIYIKNLLTDKTYIIANQPEGQFQPVFSPDGKWIAFVTWCDTTGGALWRVSSNGGTPEQLTHVFGNYQNPSWSPDGKSIAVVRGLCGPKERFNREPLCVGDLELVSLNDQNVSIVLENVPVFNRLSFSENGKMIFFQPNIQTDKTALLVSIFISEDSKADTIAIGRKVKNSARPRQTVISPDGKYIAYSKDEMMFMVPICKLSDPQVIDDPSTNLSVIQFANGIDPVFENCGKVVAWTYGNKFHRISVEKIMQSGEDARERNDNAFRETGIISVKVVPDQIIELNITVPKYYAKGIIVLDHVRILTMEKEKMISDGRVIVKDGRITYVGGRKTQTFSKDAKILDLRGATVMPGLIDLHDHMGVPPGIFPQQSSAYLTKLAFGITTSRDPASSYSSFGFNELLETGQMLGPRLFSVGGAIDPDRFNRNISTSGIKNLISQRVSMNAAAVKQYTLTTRLDRQNLLLSCESAGLNMTNEGDSDPVLQIGMLKDGSTGIEHNPVWGDVYNDVITLYAKSRTFLTPTIQILNGTTSYFYYKYWIKQGFKLNKFWPFYDVPSLMNLDTVNPGFLKYAKVNALIRRNGGKVTLGSHGNEPGIGVHNELWALQLGGLTNLEALQAATIMGAEAIGIQKDLGSIEVGKIADLIILNKNPLENIHNTTSIKYVMQSGVLYDGDTLDQLWPIYKKCPQWKMKSENTKQ